MISEWLANEVRKFGEQLGLKAFALNERSMAALQFENGIKVRLEYAEPDLWVQALLPMNASEDASRKLLDEAAPERRVFIDGRPHAVRAGFLERTGEALLAVKLANGEIEATAIDAAFRELFERALRLGRNA